MSESHPKLQAAAKQLIGGGRCGGLLFVLPFLSPTFVPPSPTRPLATSLLRVPNLVPRFMCPGRSLLSLEDRQATSS